MDLDCSYVKQVWYCRFVFASQCSDLVNYPMICCSSDKLYASAIMNISVIHLDQVLHPTVPDCLGQTVEIPLVTY